MCSKYTNIRLKGICYFDVDGTLTTATSDRNQMMNACLDKNFDIGYITAGDHPLEQVCKGDKSIKNWMSDVLCKRINDTNGKLFNTPGVVCGSTTKPNNYPKGSAGTKKGFDMKYCKDNFHKNISDKCLILFDDDPGYAADVKKYNSDLQVECSGNKCKTGLQLTTKIIDDAVTKLVNNGCK